MSQSSISLYILIVLSACTGDADGLVQLHYYSTTPSRTTRPRPGYRPTPGRVTALPRRQSSTLDHLASNKSAATDVKGTRIDARLALQGPRLHDAVLLLEAVARSPVPHPQAAIVSTCGGQQEQQQQRVMYALAGC